MSKIILTNQKRKRLSYDGNSIVEHKFTIHVALLSILITFRKDCRAVASQLLHESFFLILLPRDLVRIGSNDNQFITSQKLLSYFTSSCGNCELWDALARLACPHANTSLRSLLHFKRREARRRRRDTISVKGPSTFRSTRCLRVCWAWSPLFYNHIGIISNNWSNK